MWWCCRLSPVWQRNFAVVQVCCAPTSVPLLLKLQPASILAPQVGAVGPEAVVQGRHLGHPLLAKLETEDVGVHRVFISQGSS